MAGHSGHTKKEVDFDISPAWEKHYRQKGYTITFPNPHTPPVKYIPADKESSDKALQNLVTITGFTPPEKPVIIFPNFNKLDRRDIQELTSKPVKKPPKNRITSEAFQVPLINLSDPEKIMVLGSNDHRRRKIHNAEEKHAEDIQERIREDQKKERRKKWRQEHGLPEIARPWKEVMTEFHNLSADDIDYLKEMGFRPDSVQNPHSDTVEYYLKILGR